MTEAHLAVFLVTPLITQNILCAEKCDDDSWLSQYFFFVKVRVSVKADSHIKGPLYIDYDPVTNIKRKSNPFYYGQTGRSLV